MLRRDHLSTLWWALSGFVLCGQGAHAGVVFEIETTNHFESRAPELLEMWVEQGNLKMELARSDSSVFDVNDRAAGSVSDIASDSATATAAVGRDHEKDAVQDFMLYNAGRDELVFVDHARAEYMAISAKPSSATSGASEDVAALQAPDLMAGLEGMLGQLTEEQKAAFAGLGELAKGGAALRASREAQAKRGELRETEERATKHGYPCTKYEVLQWQEKVQELWITSWDNVEGGEEVRDAFEQIEGALGESMGGESVGGVDSMFAISRRAGGFPVVSVSYRDGQLVDEAVLRSAKTTDIDAAVFEPPAGFKRRSMPGR